MDKPVRRHIVVSAVNVRKGGTLTVLRDCLGYLSTRKNLRVTALVHREDLCRFDGISYIEIPWSAKGWCRRLWCEYVTMGKISRQKGPVDLWLSLHDTTPRVRAARQAVYCHTSFPFMKVRLRDFLMDPKIPLFAWFTKYAYRWNVRRNRRLIVQQQWMREGLSRLTRFPAEQIIVAPPAFRNPSLPEVPVAVPPLFFFPSTPDCHKNFELACRAAQMLEEKLGAGRFRLLLTVGGDENRYARWLRRRWGHIDSIRFGGFLSREALYRTYAEASCLVFPSRSETWGLPISEFAPTGRPMILADLPYAHESAAGHPCCAFVSPEDPAALASLMEEIVSGAPVHFSPVPPLSPSAPSVPSWDALFNCLLEDEDSATR